MGYPGAHVEHALGRQMIVPGMCRLQCVVVACLQSWGASRGHIGPLPQNRQDFLVPTLKQAVRMGAL